MSASQKLILPITAEFVGNLDRTLDACAAEFGFDSNPVIRLKDVLDSMDATDVAPDDYSREELRRIFVRAYALRETLQELINVQQLDLAIASTTRYAFAVGCLADRLLRREDREVLLGMKETERVRAEKVSAQQRTKASSTRKKFGSRKLTVTDLLEHRQKWMKAHGGNDHGWKTSAAKRLGLSRSTIDQWLKRANVQ